MLLPSDVALVFGRGLVQLEAAIERQRLDAFLVGRALGAAHRPEAVSDLQVAPQHAIESIPETVVHTGRLIA